MTLEVVASSFVIIVFDFVSKSNRAADSYY